jgi:hypothetical protein
MNGRRLALIVIILATGGVIAYKQVRSGNSPARSALDSGVAPRVILVADLSEAEEKCACGEIIRAVRAAQKRGIPTLEFTPDSKSELLKRYRVLSAPTVVFLDATGKETSRYEGEDEKTVEAIRSYLKRIAEGSGS